MTVDLIDFAEVASNSKLPEWQRELLMQCASDKARLALKARQLGQTERLNAFFNALAKQSEVRGSEIKHVWLDEATNAKTIAKIRGLG